MKRCKNKSENLEDITLVIKSCRQADSISSYKVCLAVKRFEENKNKRFILNDAESTLFDYLKTETEMPEMSLTVYILVIHRAEREGYIREKGEDAWDFWEYVLTPLGEELLTEDKNEK